jgi:uncharacterized membrane protein YgcG
MTNTNDERPEESGATWWHEMLSRREAGARIARIAAGTLMLPALGTVVGCGDDEEALVESEALDLQKADGWNVGSDGRPLLLASKTTTDSQGGSDWKAQAAPSTLLGAWKPTDARWQPYVVPTLVQSLGQSSLSSTVAPVHTPAMDEAYRRGLGMREIVLKAKNPETMTIVTDLPGPESVAFAAALADVADPVITFDNWPHPDGVVKAQQTLGALLYYAREVAAKSDARAKVAAANGQKLPAVFVLDSDRLTAPSTTAANVFDNRYVAKLPEVSALKSAGTTTVLYAVPDSTRTQELDDLNDYFADYRDNGMNVPLLAMSDFRPDETQRAVDSVPRNNGRAYGHAHHTPYYYGGGLSYVPLFFYTYPMFMYGAGALPSYSRYSNARVYRPSYTPARRTTVFSSRTSGGGAGVGRTKPSGFGRVSRPSGGGSFGGSRSSGSYGRSRGGGSM